MKCGQVQNLLTITIQAVQGTVSIFILLPLSLLGSRELTINTFLLTSEFHLSTFLGNYRILEMGDVTIFCEEIGYVCV